MTPRPGIREHYRPLADIGNLPNDRFAPRLLPRGAFVEAGKYRGMADYMVIQIMCLLALIMWPQIALWLPNALK